MVEKVLGKTGMPIKAWEMIYKLKVQAVLLYRSKRWVVTDAMITVLEGFHHRMARRIEGMTSRRGERVEQEWDSVDAALEATGIWSMREYMWRHQTTIAEYVTGRPTYEICTGVERMEGSISFLRWWDQEQGPTQADMEVG